MNTEKKLALMITVGLALVALPALGQTAAAETEEGEVEAAFHAYKAAIMNDRGEEAAGLLSNSTARYYAEMRDLALYGTEEELKQQSTINLFQALIVRRRAPVEELRDMTGRQILTYAIDQGWVGKDSVAPLGVQAVHVSEDVAVVDVVAEGGAGGTKMRFAREDDRWKLDLTPVIQATGVRFDLLAKQQGMTREEFLFALLGSLDGKVVDDSIWQPPLARGETE